MEYFEYFEYFYNGLFITTCHNLKLDWTILNTMYGVLSCNIDVIFWLQLERGDSEEEGEITDSSEEERSQKAKKSKKSKKSKKKKSKKDHKKRRYYDDNEPGTSFKRSRYYWDFTEKQNGNHHYRIILMLKTAAGILNSYQILGG